MASITPQGEAHVEVEQPKDKIEQIFTYHAPTDEQKLKYLMIRSAGMALARTIMTNTPSCPDQSAAIRKLREAVMTANAAIALGGVS